MRVRGEELGEGERKRIWGRDEQEGRERWKTGKGKEGRGKDDVKLGDAEIPQARKSR